MWSMNQARAFRPSGDRVVIDGKNGNNIAGFEGVRYEDELAF